MAQQVADYVVARLNEWGVKEVFAYPGDGINGLVAAFGRTDDRPTFVQARHEEMAAFERSGSPSSADRSACAPRPAAPAPSIC